MEFVCAIIFVSVLELAFAFLTCLKKIELHSYDAIFNGIQCKAAQASIQIISN